MRSTDKSYESIIRGRQSPPEKSENELFSAFERSKRWRDFKYRTSKAEKRKEGIPKALLLFVLTLITFVAASSVSIFISLCRRLPGTLGISFPSFHLELDTRRLLNKDEHEMQKFYRKVSRKKKNNKNSMNEKKKQLLGMSKAIADVNANTFKRMADVNAYRSAYDSYNKRMKDEMYQSFEVLFPSNNYLMNLNKLNEDKPFGYSYRFSRQLSNENTCDEENNSSPTSEESSQNETHQPRDNAGGSGQEHTDETGSNGRNYINQRLVSRYVNSAFLFTPETAQETVVLVSENQNVENREENEARTRLIEYHRQRTIGLTVCVCFLWAMFTLLVFTIIYNVWTKSSKP